MTYEISEAALLDDLQTDVGKVLTDLANLHPLVQALTDSRQERYVSYSTRDELEEQGRSYRRDKHARALAAAAGHELPGVESPAPGNLTAISVEASLTFGLRQIIKALHRDLLRHGVCSLTRLPAEPTVDELIGAVRQLSWQMLAFNTLDQARRDLEQLHAEVLELIDGNARVLLAETYPGATCPHCGRASLAVFFREDLIRCDRDPGTGRWEPCECTDPACHCHDRPNEFRHEWIRSKPRLDKRSWHSLLTTMPNQTRRSTR